jgi:guanylate kinase
VHPTPEQDAPYSGILFILVGPAGVGKNTLMRRAIHRLSGLNQLPTATSRPRREDEREGREHFFMTRAQFETMIEGDELLEYQFVHGTNYYGIPRATVLEALRNGTSVIADIEYLGAKAARAAFPDNVITIFILPPSLNALVERLRRRDTESAAEIALRVFRAPAELAFAQTCDYAIVNAEGREDDALDILCGIILAERARLRRPDVQARVDVVQPYPTRVRVVLTHDDSRLVRADGLGTFDIQLLPHELPHQALERAWELAAVYGIDAQPAGEWQTLGEYEGFVAPTRLYAETVADTPSQSQGIVYEYAYALRERIPAPAGMVWVTDALATSDASESAHALEANGA